jgi:hypothetical protein
MTATFASRLVRGWAALYTRGLSAQVRADRMDEIESDLWSHQEEAEATGQLDTSLAVEMATRMALGLPADIAWRLEQGRMLDRSVERSTSMGTRFIAVLAIIGALGITIAVANWAIIALGTPGAHDWENAGWTVTAIASAAGIVALSLALGGLGFVLAYDFDSPVGLLGALGACGGVLGLMGAYAAMVLLPIGSVAVILYLARIQAVGWLLAAVHVVSAPGLALGLAAYSNSSLTGISAVIILVYCLSWSAFALDLYRGLPVSRASVPSAT